MEDVRSEEEGVCKWQGVSGPQKSSLRVRRNVSMGKWMSNVNTINRAKDRRSKKGFVMSRAEFVVGGWGQALGLRMIRKSDKDLDIKGQRVLGTQSTTCAVNHSL